MATMEKNKVKFGLNKVHYAKIMSFDDEGIPTYATPVRIPGAVSLSIDASGEAENFYADNGVYYVINNNAGYEGDLEIALVTLEFATDGDKNHIRHVLYCCPASRPATESSTTEESKEVKTETLSLTATALNNGLVKARSCEQTDKATFDNWYKTVYMPDFTTTAQAKSTAKAS